MIALACRWCRCTLAMTSAEIRGRILCPSATRCDAARGRGAREPSSSPQRDALVMRLRHEGHPNNAIATLIGVTPTRVAQIVKERTA